MHLEPYFEAGAKPAGADLTFDAREFQTVKEYTESAGLAVKRAGSIISRMREHSEEQPPRHTASSVQVPRKEIQPMVRWINEKLDELETSKNEPDIEEAIDNFNAEQEYRGSQLQQVIDARIDLDTLETLKDELTAFNIK